jgi:hypothetical protein
MSIKGEPKVAGDPVSINHSKEGNIMRNISVAIVLTATVSTATADPTPTPQPPAQQAPPNYACPGPEYKQFRFWVGEWDVTRTKDGAPAGDSKIELLDQGCVIFESWMSKSGGSGHSLNVYDQADGKWHQTWIDATGNQVHYIGAWTGTKMEFRADDISTPQKQRSIMTMTFEPRPDGTIRQSGTLSTDGGKTFAPSFDLIYTKKR